MNELFATSADLYRVLELLPEGADQHPAADGGPKTVEASARRLARMIGADLADGDPADWRRLAGVARPLPAAPDRGRHGPPALARPDPRRRTPGRRRLRPLPGRAAGGRGGPPLPRFRRADRGRWPGPRLGRDLRARGGGGTPAGREPGARHDRPARGSVWSLLRTYGRALGLLRDERGVVALLVVANVAMGLVQLAEPVLFGARGRRARQWRRRCSS